MPMEYPRIGINPCDQQSDVENCISLSTPLKKKKKKKDILGIVPNGWYGG